MTGVSTLQNKCTKDCDTFVLRIHANHAKHNCWMQSGFALKCCRMFGLLPWIELGHAPNTWWKQHIGLQCSIWAMFDLNGWNFGNWWIAFSWRSWRPTNWLIDWMVSIFAHLCFQTQLPSLSSIHFSQACQLPFWINDLEFHYMSVTVLDWRLEFHCQVHYKGTYAAATRAQDLESLPQALCCWKRGFCASNPCNHIDQGVHVVVAAAHASDDGGHFQSELMPAIGKATQGGKTKWIDYVVEQYCQDL